MIRLERIKSKAHIRPANLFFIELLIVLLFFSFSVAVILQIFASADHKQELSDLTEGSVICAQSAAEAFSVSGDLSETAELVFGVDEDLGSSAVIILGDDFKISDDGRITLNLKQRDEESTAGRLSYLDISFTVGETELYSLSCAAYIPHNGGDGNG